VSGVVASASFYWENVNGVLIGHLSTTHAATASDPIAIELALSGTETAAPGTTASPTITATLTDAFPNAGTTSATVTGIQVVATDGSAAHATVSGNVSVTVVDDAPSIGAIQNAIMPSVDLTDIQGTWAPVFGADGVANQPNGILPYGPVLPTGTAAISIAIPGQVDTHTTNSAGDEIFQIAVSGSPSYTFYEYTHYTPGSQTAEMFAYSTLADAQAGLGNNEFFTLSMASNGTYDFHLVSNSLQQTEVFNLTTQKSGEGEIFEINGTTGAFSSPGSIPTTGFDLLIDGWDSSNIDPTQHTVHGNANGFGIDNGNLDTNETIAFTAGQDQTGMTIGIGKGGNATNETLQVTIWNDAHSQSATEIVTQTDGTAITVDAAHWLGTGANAFISNFKEVDVTNLGGTAGFSNSDIKLDLTSVTFNEATVVGSTTLNFTPSITDGDGNVATGSNFSVGLNGTANANGGYTLVGGPGNDVILSSSHVDTMTGGGGSNTFEFNNPLDGGGQGSGATISISNTDQITNFNPATDSVAVSAAGFGGGLTFGEVFDSTQVQNSSSNSFTNSSERFLFDQTNHTLYYSPDGTTANEHAIAILNLVSAINPTNIHVAH